METDATMSGTLMALAARGRRGGTFASRRDSLIRAAAMAIRRNSFYGRAVQLSLST